MEQDGQCGFETIASGQCPDPATEEFTVAYNDGGTLETPHTYQVCAPHKEAVLFDIADTKWELVE